MTTKKLLALVLAVVMVLSVFAGCNNTKPVETKPNETKPAETKPAETTPVVEPVVLKQAEYNTTTQVMPSNWNEFTYADNNDTQIMSYIGSSFFEYDYKFENDEK